MANLDEPRVEDISPLSGPGHHLGQRRFRLWGHRISAEVIVLRWHLSCRKGRKVGSPKTARGFPAGKRQTLARDLTNEVTIGFWWWWWWWWWWRVAPRLTPRQGWNSIIYRSRVNWAFVCVLISHMLVLCNFNLFNLNAAHLSTIC